MSLYFCAITNRKHILCKQAVANRDCSGIVEGFLHRNSPEGHLFYAENGFGVHTLTVSDISFVAVTDINTPRHQPHQFIVDLARTFAARSKLVEKAKDGQEGSLQHSFGNVLKDKMGHFEQFKANIPMAALQANVEGVTNVLRDNLDQLMKRGQLAGDLAEKTEELEGSAQMFKQISKKVESHERSKHRRMKFILIGVGVAILVVIILIILWQTGVFKSH
ncbi:hypothetical protein CRM22_003924 [Opisthorchis felineus]|uniref:Vesicle-associated membrane protein 7 n=1 Tax=Opisthorchis felineus TaxID=147828 RepID=A0A4S2LZG7_OPIFE|nr:hypothetical protein CRM22_003924 [Opisthorchis felineus]